MIRFALSCQQEHGFEGWFRDNVAFEQQAEAGQIACPTCGDTAVRKAIMAPAVARTDTTAAAERAQKRMAMMMQVMWQVRQHVVNNFDNVGPKFAEEARRIHADFVDDVVKRDDMPRAFAHTHDFVAAHERDLLRDHHFEVIAAVAECFR